MGMVEKVKALNCMGNSLFKQPERGLWIDIAEEGTSLHFR
jgi:hypothetical protein